MRRAYWSHIESIITPLNNKNDQDRSGLKRFWQFIKSMKKDHCGVPTLKTHGQCVNEAKDKADLLNKQFESVFTSERPLEPGLLPEDSPHPVMDDIQISDRGVQKMLEGLKDHKAAGPDEISTTVLKKLAPTIAPALACIFRRSYATGLLPNDWKKANVVPVFKKGKTSLASNYRPISLTCISCKLMEHILTSQIMGHANDHNILYQLQHGFRSKRSCETQLLEFQDDILRNMAKGEQTDVLIMDFSKAFDKVGHTKLLHKLHHYGIQGRTHMWIQDFLRHRTQTVVLEGEKSNPADVKSGVPQGSVLGPTLFLLYINDIAEGLTSTIRLFADDTIAYLAVKGDEDAATLQRDLDSLARWESKWQMEFHPDKCQVLTISRKKNTINHPYHLNGHSLTHVEKAKYLGITIQSDMRWNHHIQNITAKASRTLGFLKRNLQINSVALKSTAYKALVRPHLEYATSIWNPSTKRETDKIEMVQRRAARYATNRYRDKSSVGDMLHQLQWPTLAERRKHQRLTLFYNIHNSHIQVNSPQSMQMSPRQSRGHQQQYIIPRTNKDYHQNSFFPLTIREWNKLPASTIEAPSAESFKNSLMEEADAP